MALKQPIQGTLAFILNREGSLTGLNSCPYRIYLVGIICFSASNILLFFKITKSKLVRTGGRPYLILLAERIKENIPERLVESQSDLQDFITLWHSH